MFKKFFLLVLIFSLSVIVNAEGAGISVSPPKIEFMGIPGIPRESVLQVTNRGNFDISLKYKTEDFVAGSENGNPKPIEYTEKDSSISISKWIEVVGEDEDILIKAGETKNVKFRINIPLNAEPGGKYGAIVFSYTPTTSAGTSPQISEIATLILINVEGKRVETGKITNFGAYDVSCKLDEGVKYSIWQMFGFFSFRENDDKICNSLSGEEISKLYPNEFHTSFPIILSTRYNNTGNVFINPTGMIEIYDIFGNKLKNIGLKTKYTPTGTYNGLEVVDYLPVNDEGGSVLSKTFRKFDSVFNGYVSLKKAPNGVEEVVYSGFPIGYYTAKLTFNGHIGQKLTEEFSFIIFPVKQFLLYFGIVLILFFIFKIYRKSSKARFERELQRRIKDQMKV